MMTDDSEAHVTRKLWLAAFFFLVLVVGDRCFENVAQFRYLGTTISNQNLIQEEIKRRLNSGNVCCHSVQNLLSSRLLSKNMYVCI
jgi:hypothetical protein